MDINRRKGAWLAIGAMLVCAGAGIGALVSSLTTQSVVWRAPPLSPATTGTASVAVDQVQAGRAWARSAFDGGLRQCPEMNAEFLAACQAEMTALAERPVPPPDHYDDQPQVAAIEPLLPEDDPRSYDPEPLPAYARQDVAVRPAPPVEQGYDRGPVNYPAAERPEWTESRPAIAAPGDGDEAPTPLFADPRD